MAPRGLRAVQGTVQHSIDRPTPLVVGSNNCGVLCSFGSAETKDVLSGEKRGSSLVERLRQPFVPYVRRPAPPYTAYIALWSSSTLL
ncbi:hypothetical protein J6590_069767 [Homalodisca vitripennis]|nr:hypothetical protein J6590_069767 [Homalodisca vitripennis]